MAIQVSLTPGGEKTTITSNYAIHTLGGVTSSGSSFLQDLETDRWYVLDDSLGEYIAYGSPSDSPYDIIDNPPPSQLILNFKIQIDFLLNTVANSHGYESIDNAISYYNSGITAWRNEAIAFNTWRDDTLSLMYSNIFSFTADGITLPDLLGFTSQPSYNDLNLSTPSRPTFS